MEYDEVQEGAERQAIVPIENGIAPACIEPDKPGQKIVKTDEWGGNFQGLKENWVFFDAATEPIEEFPLSSTIGGTGKKIFEDSAYEVKWAKKKVVDAPLIGCGSIRRQTLDCPRGSCAWFRQIVTWTLNARSYWAEMQVCGPAGNNFL